MYNGKEKCQGCGKTGADNNRESKDSLCCVCYKELQNGRVKDVESEIKYVNIFQHFHAYRSILLNRSIHDFLKSVSNPHADAHGYDFIKNSMGNNGLSYKIDSRLIEPLKTLFSELDKETTSLVREREDIPKLANIEVVKLKNEIYNEGVSRGRDLLKQLNAGEITLKEFNEPLNRF